MNLARPKSLALQAAWLMVARVVGFAFTLLIPLVFSRLLSLSQFGLYKQLFQLVSTAQSILPLGFGLSAFYFLAREHEPERRAAVVLNILSFHFLVGLAAATTLLVYPKVLIRIFGNPELLGYAPLLAAVLLLWIFSYVIETIATANQDILYSTVFIISAQLTKGVAMLTAAFLTGSVRGALYAAIFQGFLQSIAVLLYVRFRFPGFWRHFDFGMVKTQFSYVLPLGLANLVYTLETDLHNYFVSNAFGAAAFAIYAVGTTQLPLIGILRESIASVLLTRVSYLQKQGATREILVLSLRVVRRLAIVYWPLYALLLVIGKDLIVLMYTKRFLASWPIFLVNITLIPFMIIVQDPILRAYAQYRYYLLALRIVLLGVLLAGLTWGIRELGLIGAISVVIVISLIERFVIATKVARVLEFKRQDLGMLRDLIPIAGAATAAALPALALRWLLVGRPAAVTVLSCGALFGLTYIALVYRFRILDAEERAMVRGRWLRLRAIFGRREPAELPSRP